MSQVLYVVSDQIYGFKKMVKMCLLSKAHLSLLTQQLLSFFVYTNPVQHNERL